MNAKTLSALILIGGLVACQQPPTTPKPPPVPVTSPPPTSGAGDTAAFRCLELSLDAPATVAPGEGVLTLTATNGCDEDVEAKLVGTPPFTFYLMTANGEEIWVYPDGSQLDNISRPDLAPGEKVTFSAEWTGGYDETEGVVPGGTYSLHGTLSLIKVESTYKIGTLTTAAQPLEVVP